MVTLASEERLWDIRTEKGATDAAAALPTGHTCPSKSQVMPRFPHENAK